MKNKESIKSILLVTGTLLFNYIFWDEYLGINLLLFSLFIIGTTLTLNKNALKSQTALYSAAGILITALAVVYHNSTMAKFTNIVFTLLLIGFTNQSLLRSTLYALPTSIANYFTIPKSIFSSLQSLGLKTSSLKLIWRYTKLTLVPIVFFVLFYLIFQIANPVFKELSDDIMISISDWFSVLFENISFLRILFLIWGLSIVGWVLYQSDIKYFVNAEILYSDFIKRIRIGKRKSNVQLATPKKPGNPLALKNEYRSALILMAMVNTLLLVVNIIDINWIWLNFEFTEDINLSQFVHEGTYFLILSILLSMGIMLYFFRGNQNFFIGRQKLLIAAGLWIAQNIILVISVGVRNYHYISHYGLAYKRIGVIVFLGLTVFGLVTLFLKMKNKKSAFLLFRQNSWAVCGAFVFMSLFNWDGIIMNHNISHPEKNHIDVRFLLSLSDKTLPILNEHKEILEARNDDYYSIDYVQRFDDQVLNLLNKKNSTTWLSWSLLDDKAYQYFINKNN
ncbi:MAG: DUF4173 domain-containing protein [Candidatus Margulisbacteria bacterium]|nr:DUF4173 domain-containing protein [Candidatus Margulisiibacteriota bacterium]